MIRKNECPEVIISRRARRAMLILPAVAAGALPVGDSNVWISVGNRRREFRVHVPSDEARRNPSGLIVAIHGWRNSKEWACDTIGRSSAQRHGFVVACPQGREQWFQSGWNSNIKARPITRPRPRPCQYDPRFFMFCSSRTMPASTSSVPAL